MAGQQTAMPSTLEIYFVITMLSNIMQNDEEKCLLEQLFSGYIADLV
jgi:hypothetical protein